MRDLQFDIINREVTLANGDFTLIDNPSVQNGGIIQFGQGFNNHFPTIGVGFNNIIGNNSNEVAYLMNLWQQQCKKDGAKIAEWSNIPVNNVYVSENITTKINYL